MTMVKKIAKAIYEDRNGRGCTPWGKIGGGHQGPYMRDARIALATLRDPTPKMLSEGLDALISGGDDALDTSTSDVAKCWTAMIDATLKEA